ncbi:hypothetical protein P171DRAFT_370751 [Karstenula rhodostoma CBS 690.94]|uniref:Uncharacterized protein n=1 Tax=Karstenula rhodostoma CBS 690.94 TaxID=1392251 RepID=A0A9P4U7G2_9PLEO|nr:hypothetical protein P171DRAFT_370751 [Karstenula rhodostoma CBS 690.94]
MNWWRYFRHLQRQFRPPVKPDMRRMEWTCACGEDLFADFQDDDPVAFNELHAALMAGSTLTNSVGGTASFPSSSTPDTTTQVPVSSSSASPLRQRYPQPSSGNIPAQMLRAPLGVTETNQAPPPRYLAVSSSFGGIYKGLSELDISQLKSDAQLFMAVATIYLELSSWRRLRRIFLKPVSVEFVQLSVWDVHKGYVSISDRPACVPPENEPNYDFAPRPLAPLPPVPPEIFVHYLGHRGGSHNPASNRFVWTPRLPTRKLKRLIDCDVPTYGWGIFIKEGPNRLLIFWMAILSVVCSVLLSILWATLKGDVQGASGLGSLILGVHSVIMAVFMFRFGELS